MHAAEPLSPGAERCRPDKAQRVRRQAVIDQDDSPQPPGTPPLLADAQASRLARLSPGGTAADEIATEHQTDWQRLQRLLLHGVGFQLVFAACDSFADRHSLIASIAATYPPVATIDFSQQSSTTVLRQRLREVGQEARSFPLVGIEAWLRQGGDQNSALPALTIARDALAAEVPTTLILWLQPPTSTRFAKEAPDLWAWRTAVFDFAFPLAPARPAAAAGSTPAAANRARSK